MIMTLREVLAGVAVAMVAGAGAYGQATFVSIDQRLAVQASCGASYDEVRTSDAPGVFSDTLSTSNQYGSFSATINTNLTANLMTGSFSLNSSFCGSSGAKVKVRFTLPESQKWRIRWSINSGLTGQPVIFARVGVAVLVQGASADTVMLLEPGTYEFVLTQDADEQAANGGSFTLTRLPPETAQRVTYQGMLLAGGVPYTGTADVQFTLFDAASGGAQVGAPLVVTGVAVDEGRFAAAFAPDLSAFEATSLHAQVAVRTAPGAFVPLAGRQPLNAAPFAFRALTAVAADGVEEVEHATTADQATSATLALHVQSAVTAEDAGHASYANHAAVAQVIPFFGISSNPWTRSGTLLSTLERVGIGKAPTEALDVQGDIRMNNQNLYLRTAGDGYHGVGWFGVGKPFAGFQPDGPVLFGYSGGFLGTKQTGDRVVLAWDQNGQVAIGQANTTGFALSVNGNAAKPGGGSWTLLSDARAKTDIVPLTGVLDRLLQLHGYEYTYKPQFVESGEVLPGRQIGLMATEVQQVFPDWVVRGSDGYLRVTERATTALMVEALREMRAQKDARVKELRERLRAIDGRMVRDEAAADQGR